MEQSLERSGPPQTVLYPSRLAGNALRDWGEQVRTSERVDLAFPDAQFTPIHPDDIAEVAADLLTRHTPGQEAGPDRTGVDAASGRRLRPR